MEKVIFVQALENYQLQVEFSDGVKGIVNCKGTLYGSVFEPLKDPELFAQVGIDDFGAVYWPNGADLAPDAMHDNLLKQQQKVAEETPPYRA
ncbi:DUF2442 domain-containing protein [Pontiellaceae bacterium B12227]|nr:DUF2442 domain-containing protein [Pontiellaceae bacterium B12227]